MQDLLVKAYGCIIELPDCLERIFTALFLGNSANGISRVEYPWYFESIGVMEALKYTGGTEVVYVVDSCVDFSYPLLHNKMHPASEKCTPRKGDYHGTQMVSIIAASNPYEGKVVGITTKSQILLCPIKDHDSLIEIPSRIQECIPEIKKDDAVTSQGIQINYFIELRDTLFFLNLSQSLSRDDDQGIEEIIYYTLNNKTNKPGLLVWAIGNNEFDGQRKQFGEHINDARNKGYVVTVGAVDYYDDVQNAQKAYFSNYGDLDVFAPGVQIPVLGENGNIEFDDGTSHATAVTTAAFSLAASCNHRLFTPSPYEFKEKFLESCDEHDDLKLYCFGGKLINISKLVHYICSYTGESIQQPEVVIQVFERETFPFGEIECYINSDADESIQQQEVVIQVFEREAFPFGEIECYINS